MTSRGVAFCTASLIVASLLAGPARATGGQQPPPPLPAGADRLLSANVGIGSEATVLVVVGEACQVCLDSMPFYKRLLALPRMDGVKRRLVVLAQKGVVPISRTLTEHGLTPHKLTSGPASVRELTTAPIVVVIGPDGKRKAAWNGRLTAKLEEEVIAAIGS